jgi:exodeoxyribonuclease V alpha subunit
MNTLPLFPELDQAPAATTLAQMLSQLSRWVAQGWLRELDRAFAAFLAQEAPDADPLLVLAAALASHQLGRGHACLALDAVLRDAGQALALPPDGAATGAPGEADEAPTAPGQLLAGLTLARWQAALQHPLLVGEGPGSSPLVRVGPRLYLRRYWQHEQAIRAAIATRLAQPPQDAQGAALDEAALRQALEALFPRAAGATGPDWQKLACALAARQAFSIVTGGPGTGKTTTVVRLLAVLQHLQLQAAGEGGRRLRIRLAAPTGKAAARLSESITSAVDQLALAALGAGETLRQAIPREVSTVHRLLGSRPDTRHFRHDAQNPLPVDVLVIDEASMVDLEMMAAVFAALPPRARLVLLGDKDQLASVEAGAVLGELCRRADAGHFLPATARWLQQVTGETVPEALQDTDGLPLDQAVVKLRVSHRFHADSGIGQLAEAVNAGAAEQVRSVLKAGRADLALLRLGSDSATLRRLVLDGAAGDFPQHGQGRVDGRGQPLPPPLGYRHALAWLRAHQPLPDAPDEAFDAWALQALSAWGQFQLLAALRSGPFGVEGLNQRIAQLLCAEGLLDKPEGWTLGRPVMVTRNDHGLGLMNGDVGLTLARPQQDADGLRWILRVAFADGRGGVRWVLPSRLQAVQTVFAMTVHKSQGSEFTHAALVLPDTLSPVLTRELVYTGITRARHWFTLASAGRATVLDAAVQRRVQRSSGLID